MLNISGEQPIKSEMVIEDLANFNTAFSNASRSDTPSYPPGCSNGSRSDTPGHALNFSNVSRSDTPSSNVVEPAKFPFRVGYYRMA